MSKFILMEGDCLVKMKEIPRNSIDMVLVDMPYGTTRCKWDSIICLDSMWKHLKRIVKDDAAIVMTASQPFTTKLINSNIKMFKYCWVWEKSKATGYLNSKKRPLVKHEDIVVFYNKHPTYNPQGLIKKAIPTISKGLRGQKVAGSNGDCYGLANKDAIQTHTNYPLSIIKHKVDMKAKLHPTQKPIGLMEYFIKTYTNENETVLDFCMGSGTTGVACVNTNRKFIGIELDEHYFNVAKNRIL